MRLKKKSNVQIQATKSKKELKLAFSEFYLSLTLLQNYQELNFTGFRKILKKYDKIVESKDGANFRQKNCEAAPFHSSKKIKQLIIQVENIVTEQLEEGDRSKAMKRLRVPPLENQMDFPILVVYRHGLFFGAFVICFLLSIYRFGPQLASDHERFYLNF